MKRLLPLLIGLVLVTPLSVAAEDTALPLYGVYGGALQDPVVAGDLVYVPSGRILTTWDYTDPTAPIRVASTSSDPVAGQVRGLVRWGDYLYASWQAANDSGGVAVYSLSDPRSPRLVNQFSDYMPNSFKNLWTLAVANDQLFLFDSENGIYHGSLAENPEHPSFTQLIRTPVPFDRSQVVGDRIFASGTLVLSDPLRVCVIIDASTPGSPLVESGGCGSDTQPESFRNRIQAPYAMSVGLRLSLYDIDAPNTGSPLASIDTDPATDGFIHGTHAYTLGFGEVSVHDIADPAAPMTVGYAPGNSTFGADSVTALAEGALVLTSADRFVRVDVSEDPLVPLDLSEATPVAGAAPRDIVLRGDNAVLLHENYGLGLVDAKQFEPLARFDVALPYALNQRAIETFAVEGDRAYLASWAYGLIVVQLTGSGGYELGRIEFPNLSAIAVQGSYVYLGTSTNGGMVQVVDVSVPEKPVLRGHLRVSNVNRLQVHGHRVYVADELAGLHVIDVSDPDAPVAVALWNDRCDNGGGYSAQDVELDAAGALAVVGCSTGLHVLDLSQPDRPTRLAQVPAEWATARVALSGTHAYYADRAGLKAFDISVPAVPVQVGEADLTGDVPRRLRAVSDGRVFSFHGVNGMLVFGERREAPPGDAIFADGFEASPVAVR